MEDNKQIAQQWARAKRLAEQIYDAYYLGIGVEQARKNQQSLKVWLGIVAENGYVYNGCYDEVVNLRL